MLDYHAAELATAGLMKTPLGVSQEQQGSVLIRQYLSTSERYAEQHHARNPFSMGLFLLREFPHLCESVVGKSPTPQACAHLRSVYQRTSKP